MRLPLSSSLRLSLNRLAALSAALLPGRIVRPLLLLHLAVCLAPAAEFHVAPNGDDAGTGAPDRPFATLERARDAIRRLPRAADGRVAGGATVLLRGGTYPRATPFLLTREDSGTAGSPIVYRAHPGERVSVTGAAELPRAAFSRVTAPRGRAEGVNPLIAARSHVQLEGALLPARNRPIDPGFCLSTKPTLKKRGDAWPHR